MAAKWKLILLGLAFCGVYLWGYDNAETKGELDFAKHVEEDERNARNASELQRKREQDQQLVREAQEQDYEARLRDLAAERDSFADAASGLRSTLAATQLKLRRASANASLSGVNDGATKAAMVLSDLLDKATGELERVAGTADEWYLNATSCQQFYEKIRSQ